MEIDYLANHEAFLPLLARWHHEEWGYLRPGDTLEARTERLRAECGRHGIPTTIIAFEGDTLIGSAMLLAHDMHARMDLTPWLASVFVAPEFRRRGIGAALVRRIMAEAESLDVPRLYLYTPSSESFYARLGWSVLERTTYRETPVTVMVIDL